MAWTFSLSAEAIAQEKVPDTFSPSGLFSVSEVARMLGTQRPSLAHHIMKKNIPRPTTGFGRRYYYTQADVDVIRAFWDNRVPLGMSRFSPEDVATMAGMRLGGMEQADIGKQFGATQAEVSRLLLGKTPAGQRGGQSARRRKKLDGRDS